MNSRERGFLLLTSHLGNPERKILTTPQLRMLGDRMRLMPEPREARELELDDLLALGLGRDLSRHILALLREDMLLDHYAGWGKRLGCIPITRVSETYPRVLLQRLNQDCPGCLWARGDLSCLEHPMVSLVGSRELCHENRKFAAEVGYQAAVHGFTLVSGNARGADRTAQDSCLGAGGRVISVVADELAGKALRKNLLWLSEEDFDTPFSTPRALSRNRVIHALGQTVFVAQCADGTGGTWDGTTRNLRFGWSTVACFRDGSPGIRELEQQGAWLIGREEVEDFLLNPEDTLSFFDPE